MAPTSAARARLPVLTKPPTKPRHPDCMVASTTNSASAKISFCPNPTPNYALISYEGFKLGKVVIYGMDGRIVGESINTAVLDLMALPAGKYILQVLDTKNAPVASSKIVKL